MVMVALLIRHPVCLTSEMIALFTAQPTGAWFLAPLDSKNFCASSNKFPFASQLNAVYVTYRTLVKQFCLIHILSLCVKIDFSIHPKVSLPIFWRGGASITQTQKSNFCNCLEVLVLNLSTFHRGLSEKVQILGLAFQVKPRLGQNVFH